MISEFKWANKLFMPANLARAFVRITGIKCERLLDISDEDCIAEGIEYSGYHLGHKSYKNYLPKYQDSPSVLIDPQISFLSLFKFANKMKASAEVPNLWVWVYTFEYLKDYKPCS